MCVNGATAVTSPAAQTWSWPTRRHRSSTARAPRSSGTTPNVSSPRPETAGRRPTARSTRAQSTVERSERVTRAPPPGVGSTCWTDTERRTSTPSVRNASARRSVISGRSLSRSRLPDSTSVTVTPNRANTWASSQPTAPPPSTSSEGGRVDDDRAASLVHVGTASSPGMSGMTGAEPVAMTRSPQPRTRSPTSTTPGRARVPDRGPGASRTIRRTGRRGSRRAIRPPRHGAGRPRGRRPCPRPPSRPRAGRPRCAEATCSACRPRTGTHRRRGTARRG